MNDSWDHYAEAWDINADVVLYFNNAYDILRKAINLEGKVIVDFGFGSGLLTEKLLRKQAEYWHWIHQQE